MNWEQLLWRVGVVAIVFVLGYAFGRASFDESLAHDLSATNSYIDELEAKIERLESR